MFRLLRGHTSPETAYVVDDYPYGFRLRCKIRYWLETKPGMGVRFMSQTTNPKVSREVWNKPKASTYSDTPHAWMYLNEDEHVCWWSLRRPIDPVSYHGFQAMGLYDQLDSEEMAALERAVMASKNYPEPWERFHARVVAAQAAIRELGPTATIESCQAHAEKGGLRYLGHDFTTAVAWVRHVSKCTAEVNRQMANPILAT